MITRNRTANSVAQNAIGAWTAFLRDANGAHLEVIPGESVLVLVDVNKVQELPGNHYKPVILALKGEIGFNQYKYESDISGILEILEGDSIEYYECKILSRDSRIQIRMSEPRGQALGDQMIE